MIRLAGLRTSGGAGSLALTLLQTKFPANREFNREFPKISASQSALFLSNLHISEGKRLFGRKSEQGIFNDVSGN